MVYATKHMDSIASYVAMTRHRTQLDIYYNSQEFPTFQSLCQNLNRFRTKDLVADYGLVKEHENINDIVQSYLHLGKEMTLALKSGDTDAYNDFKEDRIIFAKEILSNFDAYGHVILQAGLTKANLEITAGLRSRNLSHMEEKLLIILEQYMEAALECRTLWHAIRTTHPGVYAKDHPSYATFQEKQLERGSLAEVLYAHAPITRSFSKELYTGTGYGFATIQKQALAFEKERLQNEWITYLAPEDQELISLFKRMKQYAHFSTQLYCEHQEIDKPRVNAVNQKGKVLFKTLVSKNKLQEKEKIDTLTGGLCHALTANQKTFNKLKSLLKKVGLEANLETFIQKGKTYERLNLIHTALQRDMPHTHALQDLLKEYPHLNFQQPNLSFGIHAAKTRLANYAAAHALVDLMECEKKSGQKAITKAVILSTFGFESLTHIYAAARQAQRLHVNPIFVKENLQNEIYHLMAYSDIQAKANQCWGVVKKEAEQKNIPTYQASSYAAYQHALIERNCIANELLSTTSLTRLKQASALLNAQHLKIRLDRIEQEAKEGYLHRACLTLNNPKAPSQQHEDAIDTLITALALDETRLNAQSIMRMYNLTQITLHQQKIIKVSKAFPQHKETIDAYYHTVNGYKSAFRIFLNRHGHDWAQLDNDHPESIAVKEAQHQRNKAAFHLRDLIQNHGTSSAFKQLLEPLKTTTEQLLHQGDCHESINLAKVFKGTFDVRQKAELGYQLLERFVLETGTKSNRSATYALKEENLTLSDLSRVVQSSIHLNASNTLNRELFEYKQDVSAFGKAYQTLMDEFEGGKQKNAQKESQKEHKTFISNMTSYPEFWESRMRLAQKAYDLIHSSEQVANFISAQTLHKMGGYAHIHETFLLLKGYLAAKERRDPIAFNIAAEISEIIAFEEHEHETNLKAPLAYGIRPALFHCEIDRTQLTRDAEGIHSPHPIRARDIHYLFDKDAAQPSEIAHLIQQTTRIHETPHKTLEHPVTKTKKQQASSETPLIPRHESYKKQRQKRPEISSDEFKAFTKEVKQHLTHRIEDIAVALLGQPKEIGRNGIWKWSDGVRLHTRTNSRVPRGTFKIYSEGTENIDVFAMIKRTQNVTQYWDAVQMGANLCGLSFKSLVRIQKSPHTTQKVPFAVSANGQQKAQDNWTPLFPVPRDGEHVTITIHKGLSFMLDKTGHETMRFAYRDENNSLLGYVVRLEDEQGKKQTLPLTYCTNNNGKATWKWKGFGDKTPLYGLDRVAKHPDKPILLVEGEKAADAAQKQFPNLVVMSWVGGSAGVHKIDLTPIYNKTVLMWPDNDQPGFKAANTLNERFEKQAKENKCPNTFVIIDIPRDKLPQKWDLADTLPDTLTVKDIQAHIGQALNAIQLNVNTFQIEHEKEETRQRTNHMYEKTFTFNEITQCATKAGLSFLNENDRMPLILHTANETYKELSEWHTLNDEKQDFEMVKHQAILTGLYTAWAHEREHDDNPDQSADKAEQIGALAGRLHREQGNKNDPHAILWKAEKEVVNFEQQTNAHQENQLNTESITAHSEGEIWHASRQCQSLTGKVMSLDLAKEIQAHLQETYHRCKQVKQTRSREIRSVIKHMITQKIQRNEIKSITHEEAVAIHAQHEAHRQQSMQQHHEQIKHIGQQHVAQRHVSRGLEL